jgi:hypothetical protein
MVGVRSSTAIDLPRLAPERFTLPILIAQQAMKFLPERSVSEARRRLRSINIPGNPRIVFGVDVSLEKVVRWLRKPRSIRLQTVREACLSESELEASMEVGEKLQQLGIQGLLFPSVTGTGRILVVYLDNCDPAALKLCNLDELKKQIAEFR